MDSSLYKACQLSLTDLRQGDLPKLVYNKENQFDFYEALEEFLDNHLNSKKPTI